MQTRPRTAVPPLVTLDGSSATPLYRQLYQSLRDGIVGRTLRPGTRLPASRLLAGDLRVSRNTVINAFDQLVAEGYLVSRLGSGTYVSESIPEEMLWTGARRDPGRTDARPACRLSARGRTISRIAPFFPPVKPAPFRHGLPALDAFPLGLWARMAAQRWRRMPRALLGYGHAAGYRPLREAVAEYLTQARGVRCEADQVVMVAGSQQALYLVAQLILDPGDAAWIEDPGYLGARAALQAAQARLVPVPLDEQGLRVAEGIRRGAKARLIYVTPSNQYPTTVTMSLSRRMELLEWARRGGAWILEDDYDSEFRFTSRPIASLQGLDAAGRVIYLGTFSKLLAPGLRLGYMVLPPQLVDPFATASALVTRHLPSVEQVVLADFIAEGHLARHVRRMRTLYEERRRVLLDVAGEELGRWLEIQPPDAGTHLLARLRGSISDRDAARAAAELGVETRPLSAYCLAAPRRNGLVLGYGAFRRRELRAGAAALARALRQCDRRPAAASPSS